jgi:serine/threonine-protein kinase HipA
MRKLLIQIELNGKNVSVGEIAGKDSNDACFTYDESYASDPEHRPISISLPLEKRTFDAQITRNFFEGLLPEGFTRRCVAEWMHTEEKDYLSILAGLGQECLGAIKVIDEYTSEIQPEYRKLTNDQVLKLAKEGATESAELVTKSHLSLTGASGKVGLYYDGKHWFLPIGEAPSTHIVKQSHIRLKKIVWNEQLCLLTARKLGIEILAEGLMVCQYLSGCIRKIFLRHLEFHLQRSTKKIILVICEKYLRFYEIIQEILSQIK